MQRSKTCAGSVPVEMVAAIANPPVEIGSRGTVGSLIMREIEHFSRLELGRKDGPKKPRSNVGPVAATQKKKKRGSSRLILGMCSMVEISDSRPVGVPGFGYRNLKSDVKKLQV
ncbi:Ankyrin repeat family protein [Hibiscus syriacus]|uniref:Ankyrin repeat family protein n=1 Tax=Hibiscus syriacus TaxID=106335 RepID=A0A6A3CED6_HIBSY|nr:Ankyrin repeat family protein [Hibiscus syriacus]